MTVAALLATNLGVTLLCMGLLWLLSIRPGDPSFIDAWWPMGFVVVAWVMTFLLARWSGVGPLEARLKRHKPGYADYIAVTSGFVPLPRAQSGAGPTPSEEHPHEHRHLRPRRSPDRLRPQLRQGGLGDQRPGG